MKRERKKNKNKYDNFILVFVHQIVKADDLLSISELRNAAEIQVTDLQKKNQSVKI